MWTERETDGRNDRANDEQDVVSFSTQAEQQTGAPLELAAPCSPSNSMLREEKLRDVNRCIED